MKMSETSVAQRVRFHSRAFARDLPGFGRSGANAFPYTVGHRDKSSGPYSDRRLCLAPRSHPLHFGWFTLGRHCAPLLSGTSATISPPFIVVASARLAKFRASLF